MNSAERKRRPARYCFPHNSLMVGIFNNIYNVAWRSQRFTSPLISHKTSPNVNRVYIILCPFFSLLFFRGTRIVKFIIFVKEFAMSRPYPYLYVYNVHTSPIHIICDTRARVPSMHSQTHVYNNVCKARVHVYLCIMYTYIIYTYIYCIHDILLHEYIRIIRSADTWQLYLE